ncbi:MAG: hypothetical protein DRP74_07645, partial [Candidatus Omnitrophota bacterium]
RVLFTLVRHVHFLSFDQHTNSNQGNVQFQEKHYTVSIYLSVAIMKKELNLKQSLYEILRILSITLFQKDLITPVVIKTNLQNKNINNYNQLTLSDLYPDSSGRFYTI